MIRCLAMTTGLWILACAGAPTPQTGLTLVNAGSAPFTARTTLGTGPQPPSAASQELAAGESVHSEHVSQWPPIVVCGGIETPIVPTVPTATWAPGITIEVICQDGVLSWSVRADRRER